MRIKKWGLALLLVCAGSLLSGCYVTHQGPDFDARAYRYPTGHTNGAAAITNFTTVESTNRIRPDWLKPSADFYRIGPGDHLELEIVGDSGSREQATVGPDGKIYFYVLPGIDVWGLSLTEAKDRIEKELKDRDLLRAPIISVQLRGIDSTRVWLLGRVDKPGVYPMSAPMTLLEAISLAGGTLSSSASGTTEDLADLSNSFVVRNGERLPVNIERLLHYGDMSQNIYLEPDDFVYFPSAFSRDIYVLGAVRSPKAVLRQHNTLVAAVADAGGPINNAYLSHVAIVRGSLDDPRIAIIDLAQVMRGKQPDVRLEPRDIVYVPFSPYRFLTKYLDLILRTFTRALAINNGANAAVPGTPPAGVAIGSGSGGTVLVPAGTIITPGTKLVPVQIGPGGTIVP
ncbi:MAG TPA: SLBB domain-containing protein [Verrucomicrobiae bacterium]|jgi:protein involved in polysaccharide export with SLBB domain|nr:SLBB domain-containing protein [Verrucomicrobiae bacterium]